MHAVKTMDQVGAFVRDRRRRLGVTQKDLAMTSGTGLRFIVDLEKGKPTCHAGKVLQVVEALGCRIGIVARDSEGGS